jgi:hypothetical protein
VAVLRSVIRQPRQLPALLRVAADARAAQLALRAGRQRLGAGLSFPGFHPVPAPGEKDEGRPTGTGLPSATKIALACHPPA